MVLHVCMYGTLSSRGLWAPLFGAEVVHNYIREVCGSPGWWLDRLFPRALKKKKKKMFEPPVLKAALRHVCAAKLVEVLHGSTRCIYVWSIFKGGNPCGEKKKAYKYTTTGCANALVLSTHYRYS